jgi:2-polyprenyl-6-methoxyphenol hydroxylase-like FAD-dependent oxidoreductase
MYSGRSRHHRGPTAIVVGAGIAGLAAAKALGDLGYSVGVVEADAELRTEGAALTLWPNALRALRELGLDDVLESSGTTVSRGVTLTPSGETIAEAPLAHIAQRFGPLVSVHRGDLLRALFERVDLPVEFGLPVQIEDGVARAGGEALEADLIVGADGIGSAVRELIAPGVKPRPAGYGAWRGIAHIGRAAPQAASETLGCGRRFGMVPLSGGRTYWFAAVSGATGTEDLHEAFAGWHEPIPTLLEATPPQERSFLELADLPPLPRWHGKGVVLVGDAAHAMTPNLGQGAAQALLDVAMLRCQLTVRSPARALTGYERARKRKAEQIVRRSRAAGLLAQASHPLAVQARNGVARRVPPSVVARLMGGVLR